jgi:hypothetical protein
VKCSFECRLSNSEQQGHQCGDGSCVSGKQRCDARADCADGSDELGCLSECVLPKGGRGVLCSGDSGMCLQRSRVCDGEAQCPDGSDEMGCGFQCETPEGVPGWLCSTGACLGANHMCDGEWQCLDGADETGCFYNCIKEGEVQGFYWCSGDEDTCIGGNQVCKNGVGESEERRTAIIWVQRRCVRAGKKKRVGEERAEGVYTRDKRAAARCSSECRRCSRYCRQRHAAIFSIEILAPTL